MHWLQTIFTDSSMIQAIMVISLVSTIGIFLGKLKIFGISLGVTFVFFTGIVAAHFGITANKDMLYFAQNFGLILFVYGLGLQVGPGFFSSLKRGGISLNMMGLGVIVLGILTALIFHYTTHISLANVVGLLCGAVTNTPALGAAQQAVLQIDPSAGKTVTEMALACAVTYPLGVVGVILAIIVIRAMFTKNNDDVTSKKEQVKMKVNEFLVLNPGIYGKSIKDVMKVTEEHFVISRVWRNGQVSIPTSETILQKEDHVLVCSTNSDIEKIKVLFGEQENVDWNKEGIDWNAIDSQLVSRRILITKEEMNGVKLGSLRLRNLYGINITRVNRAGIDLFASSDLRLQLGDKLTIVGEANSINMVARILGDEFKRLDNPNMLAIFVGIFFGMLLGALPIYIPGITTPVKLGIAGGPIIVGILMGAFGPRFHISTYTTTSANLMLRQLGITIYLACLGLDSGAHFFETIFCGEGMLWIAVGFAITMIPILIVGFLAAKVFKLDYANNIGMLCGSMANPMALNYANTTVSDDEPSVAYATVYPLSMFIRVISAQLIIAIFS